MNESSYSCSTNKDNLALALSWIYDEIDKLAIPPKVRNQIEVACEEAIVNVFSYAYPQREGRVELRVQCSPSNEFMFTTIDSGIPFNPLEHETSLSTEHPLDMKPEGGVGIVLMKELMDHVAYERKDNTNLLRLVKKWH